MGIQVVKVENFENNGVKKVVPQLYIGNEPLYIQNSYLCYKSSFIEDNTLYTHAVQLKSLFNQLWSDHRADLRKKNVNDSDFSEDLAISVSTLYTKINDRYMQGYLTKLSTGEISASGKPVKKESIKVYIETFKAFFEFVKKFGLLSKEPNLSYTFNDFNPIKTIQSGFDRRIHDLFYDYTTFKESICAYVYRKNSYLQDRDVLALKILYTSGLRPHELLRNINFTLDRVRKLVGKTGQPNESKQFDIVGKRRKLRTVVLHPEIVKLLREYVWNTIPKMEAAGAFKLDKNACIFITEKGEKISSAKHFTNVFNKSKNIMLFESSSLTPDERKLWNMRNLYSTRHCFATNLIITQYETKGSVDRIEITQLMGHSSFDTTLSSYIYLAAKLVKNARAKAYLGQRASDELENESKIA